jgi:hypothetical protein
LGDVGMVDLWFAVLRAAARFARSDAAKTFEPPKRSQALP